MKKYIATRDLPPTSAKKGYIIPATDLTITEAAIMLATGLIEEVPEKKEWRAEDLKEGDTYWSHDPRGLVYGYIYEALWSGDDIDIYRRSMGNCFETEELAQAAYDKLMKK